MNNGTGQHLFVCMRVHPSECTPVHVFRGWEVGSLLPPSGFRELILGHQAWWHVSYSLNHLPRPCSTFLRNSSSLLSELWVVASN